MAQTSDLRDMAPEWKDFRVTVGARFWRTEWTNWANSSEPNGYVTAGQKWAVIPVLSVRYKSWFVSGSAMQKTTFSFPAMTSLSGGTQFNVIDPFSFSRRERDVNIGYFLVPDRLAISLGWKTITFSNQRYNEDFKGPTIGLSATSPVTEYLALYGNLAYGTPKVNDSAPPLFRDARGNYLLTEFGVAIPLGHMTNALTGAALTAGYRYQRLSVNPNGNHNQVLFANVKTYDTTQGPVVGISVTF